MLLDKSMFQSTRGVASWQSSGTLLPRHPHYKTRK
nr:MAG TPA: hypothetical protein [Caudoviricetes sp.]